MDEDRVALPAFTDDGVLPAGDYALTLDELAVSSLVTGSLGAAPSWDRAWRA